MSTSPLRPLAHPAQPRPSLVPQLTGLASSSTSSSVTQPSRADQVVYRFYLKTLGILVEGRLTHYGGSGGKAEKKKDKWVCLPLTRSEIYQHCADIDLYQFNLALPDLDIYKSDLQIYRSISSYSPLQTSPGADCPIPPLLVAFILDTSDLPPGQALIWNRGGSKVTIDNGLLGTGGKGKGKGKEKERNTGIILERWTYRAERVIPNPRRNGLTFVISIPRRDEDYTSEQPAHTAYRMGIIHFRALFAFIRLLPAWRLYRRLRRANNGLRLGIKLWSPEGFPSSSEGLQEAWDVMERGLIPLDTGLHQLVVTAESRQEDTLSYKFPTLDLFGVEYDLGVEYRPEIDFHVEDMESVLSEKFVDMDEDWFTPTVARHRMEEEGKLSASNDARARTLSGSSGIPNSSPIPQRQQAANFGSLGTGSRPPNSRLASGAGSVKSRIGSGADKWGALAEGLPFTAGSADPNRVS
jgi:autophagy-related protein 13